MKYIIFVFFLFFVGANQIMAQSLSDTIPPPPPPPIERGDTTGEEKVFIIVEDMPEYPGGNAALYKFISDNIKYPKEAKKNKIEGKVIVQFTVNKQGKVEDIKIVRGIGFGCDEEVIRVVKRMPDWKPGKQRGKPVSVRYNLPVAFKL